MFRHNVTNMLFRACLWGIPLLSLLSCEKDVAPEADESSPICLSGVLHDAGKEGFTKGETPASDGFSIGDTIGLMAYRTGVNTWKTIGSSMTPNLMYDQKVTRTADGWVYAPTRYWIPQYMYSFFAYAPYHTPIANLSGSSVQGSPFLEITTPELPNDHVDLKTAACFDKEDNGWPVELPFKHAFTRVRFSAKVTANEAYYQATVTGVEMTGIATNGRLSLDSCRWSAQGMPGKVTVMDEAAAGDDLLIPYSSASPETSLGAPSFLIPQTMGADAKITFYYTIVSPFEVAPIQRQAVLSLDKVVYAPNQALHYVLTIRLTGVAFSVQVDDWNVKVDPNNIALE